MPRRERIEMEIREYDPSRDLDPVRTGFVELQEVARRLWPGMPPGEQIADAYLDLMFRRCREFDGSVLVAVELGAVVGFVTVWTRYRSTEPGDDPTEHGFISDLVVLAANRGGGIGRTLLRAAESRAREAGARVVRLSVLAGNVEAVSLYAAQGFKESQIYLEKDLT
jgi:ribosomal protein S18 acetylase RimI-like enzyme